MWRDVSLSRNRERMKRDSQSIPQRRGGSLFIEGRGLEFPSYLLLNGLNPLSYKLCWGQSPCSTITSVAHVIITLQTLERNIITLQTLERNGSYITNFILLLQHDVIINHPHIQLGDGLIELTRLLHRVTIQLKERLQARYLLFQIVI